MSAVALERQLWCSSNLQDFNTLQPPAATPQPASTCPHLAHTYYQPPIKVQYYTRNFPPNFHVSSKFLIHKESPFHLCTSECVARSTHEALNRVKCVVNWEDTSVAPPKMHAQVTSGSLAVSTIEDITAPKRYSSESLCLDPDNLLCNPATAPSCTISSRLSTAATSSDSHQCFDFDTSGTTTTTTTTTGANNCTDASLDSFSPPQSSLLWNSKNLSNTNSRGSLTSKSKGVCCGRRRLIDEEGYIRRAACICVNKEETEVLLVTSKKDPCAWLVPGGGLEVGEDAITAAQREAWEEAGIQGVVERFLGLFESCHHSGTKKHRTAVFVFVVTKEHKDFPEAILGRRRRWFNLEEALLLLARHRPLQSAYIQLLMMSKLKMAAT